MRPICVVATSAPRLRIYQCARSGARPRLAAGPPGHRISRRPFPPARSSSLPAPEIKFGTDGWRGVVADDFTYASVRRVARGIADYLMTRSKDPLAVVGYDCRFASEEFARTVADVFAVNGVRSLIFDRPSPTQVASWTVIDRKATGAAVIPASHNPYLFNGVKYKPETGSSAPSNVIADLEQRINAV